MLEDFPRRQWSHHHRTGKSRYNGYTNHRHHWCFTCKRQPSQRLKIFDGGYFARNKPSLKDFLQHSPHCMRGFCVLTIKLWSGTTTEYWILTCRRQIPTDGNVKKMNGNLLLHSYRQYPRPSSNSWNATLLRNVVSTTDVSVVKQGSNAQTFVLVLKKKNSATMLMTILSQNRLTRSQTLCRHLWSWCPRACRLAHFIVTINTPSWLFPPAVFTASFFRI